MYELKIYGGVICHGNEEQCKIWRGIDVLVQNWPEDFDKFSPKHSNLENGNLMSCFWPNIQCLSFQKWHEGHFRK